ncbi:MAG: hypothetical protein KUG72_03320 [Pseudomonadales bacterium]|nr:hypothetical protein [Pseudomonadales bacterium]
MRQTLHLGTISAANIAFAFLYQWYAITTLGAGIQTDALFAGMTIPQLALAIISGSLMHALVPLLSCENEESLKRSAWSFIALIGGLFSVLAFFLFVTASLWVPLIVPGFSEKGMNLTIELTRIQLVGMVFSAINGVQWATYHAKQQFIWPEFSPLLVSVALFPLLMWALPRFGVVAAAWIFVLRLAIQSLLLAPGMGRPVYPDLKSDVLTQAWGRIKPLLLGAAYFKTDPLVDRLLLSMSGSGSLSLYYLAQQIYNAANQVLNKAIAAPMVPQLSRSFNSGNHAEYRHIYYRKILQMGILSLLALLVLGVIGQDILELLFGYGKLTKSKVDELWWIMIWLGGVFIGGAVGQIASTSFYACGDTKTPTQISIFTYTVYIPCKILVFYQWGVMGLAITTSVYYMINLSLLMYFFRKRFIV